MRWLCRIAGGILASSALVASAQGAESLRVVTLGDSHSTVEAGFARSLASAMGVRVEHARQGVVGASVKDLLEDLEGRRAKFNLAALSAWCPNLVLVAFGTNEAKNWRPSGADAYSKAWGQVLGRLQELFPGARIIVLGPPDADLPGIGTVRAIQEAMAASCGAGWIDRVQVMGGEGAMNAWRTAQGGRYASKDGIHLTAAGYSELAKRVAEIVAHGALGGA